VKLWLATLVTGLVASMLTGLSCWMLRVPLERSVFFLSTGWMMAFGLNALALSMGALFPNFKETNPARIVSGFGGTLCLIISFVYIACAMALAILPALGELGSKFAQLDKMLPGGRMWTGLLGIAMLTFLLGAAPYVFAKKRIKDLDYFRGV
jgi:ABC-2 type transport system permease protein